MKNKRKISTFEILTVMILICVMLHSCNNSQKQDKLNLKDKLEGEWKAKAFNGELHEKWQLDEDGFMRQEGIYIESGDTLYQATTKIEKVGKEIILFSVIKNSSPKIFQSVKRTSNEIIFENKDYKNPNEVKYQFIDELNYERTIRGIENDSIVEYEFKFRKEI